jgi:5-(carboxyamino)imidazole ribonucleotide synthase
MLVAPATALGIDLLLLAADAQDSGAQVSRHEVGNYTDLAQVLAFAKNVDVVTFEDESVSLSVVKGLESAGVKVYPSSSTINLLQSKVATLVMNEKYDHEIAVLVARSPHGQATSWPPTEILRENNYCAMTITPAQKISSALAEQAQKIALETAQAVGVVGVMAVVMSISDENIFITDLKYGPHESGLWSIEASVTSEFEQHLRAILDLPLGNPAMSYKLAVTGKVIGGDKADMYRPYLHLMARNPSLHFHQYRTDVKPGVEVGHLTVCGDDLNYLTQEIEHARDYMSGVIDE